MNGDLGLGVIVSMKDAFSQNAARVQSSMQSLDATVAASSERMARNLDRIMLLTGDGDFLRLVVALQNMGCRVEVIGFHNVSKELREGADSYISGFLVPGLMPIAGTYRSRIGNDRVHRLLGNW